MILAFTRWGVVYVDLVFQGRRHEDVALEMHDRAAVVLTEYFGTGVTQQATVVLAVAQHVVDVEAVGVVNGPFHFGESRRFLRRPRPG